MSRYKANPIDTPDPKGITKITRAVVYNRPIKLVSGLDGLVNTEKGVLACADNGAEKQWFSCRTIEAAAEVMEPYHNGEYLSVEWYQENQ